MKKAFAVIGLDTFGLSLVEELATLGAEVIAFDNKESELNKVADFVTRGATFDYKDMKVLVELGIKHVDHAIIAISGDIESSILLTMLLKDLGIPKVTVEVESDYHEKVVLKLGATGTISPAQLTGVRIARKLLSQNVIDYYNVNNDYGLYEIQVSHTFMDKELKDLNLRNAYGINIVLIKRNNEIIVPKATDILLHDDVIMVVGKHKAVAKFENVITKK